MTNQIKVGAIHHLRLTVTDVNRSREFYTGVLGFQVAMAEPPPADDPAHDLVADALQGGVVLMNAGTLIGLRPAAQQHIANQDRFDELRCGIDHLSFGVESRADLEQAARLLDERGVPHGEIKDLGPFGISVLAFRDPDNIQLELTAPM
jgi:catechol 2,3-dioxygenase-like lactoylglutathione lyase family enzyme